MSAGRDRFGNVTVVILGGGRGTRLDPLTRHRSKPAVPLAGKYRLIDVPISNSINSGMPRIFILTQFNSVSLHRHITSTFKFDPYSSGFVEILAAQQTPSDDRWYQGTADAVRRNLDFMGELYTDHVLVLAGDHLYRMDYSWLLREHTENDADVTLSVLPCSETEIAAFGAVRVDDSGRVIEFREKPQTAADRKGMEVPGHLLEMRGMSTDRPYLASMGIYIFNHKRLRECLDAPAMHADFGSDVLPAIVDTHHVHAHFYGGYWRDIGTIRAFYEAHMDMVRFSPPFDFHDPEWPIYTHPRYLPGSRMTGVQIERSMIADGARISESMIEESVIGVRSRIRSATVRRSLIMGNDDIYPDVPGGPDVGVGEGSVIENAIVDKNVRIGKNVRLVNESGVQEAEGDGWVIRNGVVVLAKGAVVPDGAVV